MLWVASPNTDCLETVSTNAFYASESLLLFRDLEVDCVSAEDFCPDQAPDLWRKVR